MRKTGVILAILLFTSLSVAQPPVPGGSIDDVQNSETEQEEESPPIPEQSEDESHGDQVNNSSQQPSGFEDNSSIESDVSEEESNSLAGTILEILKGLI